MATAPFMLVYAWACKEGIYVERLRSMSSLCEKANSEWKVNAWRRRIAKRHKKSLLDHILNVENASISRFHFYMCWIICSAKLCSPRVFRLNENSSEWALLIKIEQKYCVKNNENSIFAHSSSLLIEFRAHIACFYFHSTKRLALNEMESLCLLSSPLN
jgi:hypothetical protein